jgi:hypothetical protein
MAEEIVISEPNMKVLFDAETQTSTVVPMTTEEVLQYEAFQAKMAEEQASIDAMIEAKKVKREQVLAQLAETSGISLFEDIKEALN